MKVDKFNHGMRGLQKKLYYFTRYSEVRLVTPRACLHVYNVPPLNINTYTYVRTYVHTYTQNSFFPFYIAISFVFVKYLGCSIMWHDTNFKSIENLPNTPCLFNKIPHVTVSQNCGKCSLRIFSLSAYMPPYVSLIFC